MSDLFSCCKQAQEEEEELKLYTYLEEEEGVSPGCVCDGRWKERCEPYHVLQTSTEQRTRLGQQWQPLHQLPGHWGAITYKVSSRALKE